MIATPLPGRAEVAVSVSVTGPHGRKPAPRITA
jgi:hypothetical protein